MSRYAMLGEVSKELLTYNGKVIVHDNREEFEFLVPTGGKVIRITGGNLGQPTIRLRDHPDMASVRWPLDRRDFR